MIEFEMYENLVEFHLANALYRCFSEEPEFATDFSYNS